MKIGSVIISPSSPVFIVAEISANHLGNLNIAEQTVRAAAAAGADAVKFQTFTADTITLDCDNEHFQINRGTPWDGRTLHELYREAAMPWEWHERLRDLAVELGLQFFSTPFDKTAVDFLEALNVPAYKIASFEITDIPLIEYAAAKRKPMIISTGIATKGDIEHAVEACRRSGNEDIALLKCTSAYPAGYSEANLRLIPELAARFELIVGLSDHTPGISVPLAAVALGARIIEKHFTLSRAAGGPDASFSLEPAELRLLASSIREVEAALGDGSYELPERAKDYRRFSRSLFAVKDIAAGEAFTEVNVRSVRPGSGLAPGALGELLGKRAKRDVSRGTPLSWDLVD